MFCSNCGNQLPDSAKFCGKCGSPVEVEEVQQSSYTAVKKEEKKKRTMSMPKVKSKWGIVVLAVAIVLVIGFLSKDLIIHAVSPELYTKLALKNTIDSVLSDYSKMESILFGGSKDGTSSTVNLKLAIEDARSNDQWTNAELSMIRGMGVDINTIFDEKNKELYLNGSFNVSGSKLISINSKLDDNELLLNIPELFDEVLSVPSKNFGREWNNSILGMESGLYVEDTLDISISNLTKTNPVEKMDEKTKNSYLNAFKVMTTNAHYEKNDSINLIINGSKKKCNGTIVTLEPKYVKQGLIALLDSVQSDNRLSYWLENLDQNYSVAEFKENIEYMKDEIEEYFEVESVAISLFTNDGNIVKSEMKLVEPTYKEEMTIGIELLGGKNPLDDIYFEFSVEDEKLTYESKGNHTGNKNMFVDDTVFEIHSYYGRVLKLESSTEIDLGKNKDNLKFDIKLSADDGVMSFNTTGDFASSSKSMIFKSDDINFSFRDSYDDLRITFSADIKAENSVGKKPDYSNYKKLEALKMTENDLYDFLYTVEENGYWLQREFEDIFGY